jgi:AraC-like DNA-binding protein
MLRPVIPVFRIGMEVGYQSESAFCRAFKREFGLPPARHRKAGRRLPASRAPGAAARPRR